MTGTLSYSGDEIIDQLVRDEREPHREPVVRITGLMVQYYHVCKRELWFMSKGIDIDRGTPNIRRGTHVDETSYRDKRSSFQVNGRIAIDIVDSGEVMEVKVSSSLEEPPRMQLLYYLWYLDRILDIQREGVLAYPEERSREQISLSESNAIEIEETLRGIIDTVSADTPPELEKKPYCDSCLYQDICWL
ncbi:CRISPR-associated protein Cas4 [Haladaptatus sp. R4]|uniref:CRISPR-associated protein Cas4 n=1 Tax=Haladaptatus sp. R4 TaxID=1679489 RepID=UPI0007B48875|nr:CRISPR-associated protein Cas4 [Haladaptatus sp. R4]KZN24962.1 CRISPR-associated protein Cas4 [Haladaptatus sp. R4]